MVDWEFVQASSDARIHRRKLKIPSPDQPLVPIFASASSNSLMGSRDMVSFGPVNVNKSRNSFYGSFDPDECWDEYSDLCFFHSEKKRRLTMDQVQFLEKSFMAENRLEPERKNQLANELGVQPRQVAVWFQNRRARSRTKQVETDYETLHARYISLKTDYDDLLKENDKLKAEVFSLKGNPPEGHPRQCDAQGLPKLQIERPVAFMVCEDEPKLLSVPCSNQEVQNHAGSDKTELDFCPLTKGILSWLHDSDNSLQESDNSLQVFEPEQSDFYQNGDDNLSDELLQRAYFVPKIEEALCHTPPNYCNLGLPIEDHGFGLWSY